MSFLGSVIINSLSYLKNAGFDPVVIRNDGYCNVLYYHADSASPVAWDVESQFPCSKDVGQAPAAIVESRREPCDALALRQLDYNRKSRPMSPAIKEVGIAPVAIVESRREPCNALALRQLDYNSKPRPMSPAIKKAKFKEAVDDYHAKFEFVDLRRPMSSSGPFYCFDYHS
ncbi:hypothetical protein JHK87_047500 [Glycine soja]|nr:hypothetical protein JHK87_047500 [Glycine soja]